MPALAAAPGMPHTTLEASSWAITLPPAATISLPPRVPSEPMPVSTTARTPPCQRQIDRTGLDDLPIDGFVRRPVARARQMLGENCREGRRHMLRDQDR